MAMPQISYLSTNWWVLALRGVAGILLGLLAFTVPGITVAALVTLFALYLIVDGVLAIMAALRGVQEHDRWGWMLLEGLAGLFVGMIALLMPGIGALAFVWLVAIWAVVSGALEIGAAIRLRKLIQNEWMLLLAGALSVIFGIFLAMRPGIGGMLLVTWIGVYALFFGVITLVLAFRVRKWAHEQGATA